MFLPPYCTLLAYAEGYFPSWFKFALVVLLLKILTLTPAAFLTLDITPTSINVSKILEPVFFICIDGNTLLNLHFQSLSVTAKVIPWTLLFVSPQENISPICNGKACLSVCLDLGATHPELLSVSLRSLHELARQSYCTGFPLNTEQNLNWPVWTIKTSAPAHYLSSCTTNYLHTFSYPEIIKYRPRCRTGMGSC